MADLHDLLDRATDAIEPRGGAADALRTARRRRTRRRGTVAVLAASAAVVAIVVGVRVATAGTGESAPPPAESPTVTPTQEQAPEIDPGRVERAWNPRGAEGLPVTDLGVPRVMPSAPAGSIDRPPVALLDDGSRILAVAADGAAVVVEPPRGTGRQRTVTLSADGTSVVVDGAGGTTWRHVNSPMWRPGRPEGMEAPDAALGATVQAATVGASYGLLAPGRAFLPLRGDPDRLDLTPVAWVDDDRVAFRVTPPGSPKEYLVTWNVETGELSRISCWYTSFQASFATDLLG